MQIYQLKFYSTLPQFDHLFKTQTTTSAHPFTVHNNPTKNTL